MKPSRRTFLQWVTALGSFLLGLMVGIPGIRAFLSPAFRRPPSARWVKLGEADQIETGVPIRVDFSETINDAWVETRVLRGVWIYTEDGETFTVYNGRCTHLGCSYSFLKDRNLFNCPCHRGSFDFKTGKVLDGPPPRQLDTLDTKIEDGILYVAYRDFREGIPEKIPVG